MLEPELGSPAAEGAPGLGPEQSLEGSLARSYIGTVLSKGAMIGRVSLQRLGDRPDSWIACSRELERCDASSGQLIEEDDLEVFTGGDREHLDCDVIYELAKEGTDRHDRDPFEVGWLDFGADVER